MSSLFQGYIYPDNEKEKYLDYFKEYFDSVFITFNPFLKIIGSKNHDNEEYPEPSEIREFGKIIKWLNIKENCGFKTYNEIIFGLSISKYSKNIYKSDHLSKILIDYCKNSSIWIPAEGTFCESIQGEIKRIFELNFYDTVIIQNEFGDETKEIETFLLEKSLAENHISNIYSKDKKILFSIDWDSYYFLFCSSKEIVEKSLKESCLEGFFSTDKIGHLWEFDSEISELYKIHHNEC